MSASVDLILGIAVPFSALWTETGPIRQCRNGHVRKSDDGYCPKCGAPVESAIGYATTELYDRLLAHFGNVDDLRGVCAGMEKPTFALWGMDDTYKRAPDDTNGKEVRVLGYALASSSQRSLEVPAAFSLGFVAEFADKARGECERLGVTGNVELWAWGRDS